MFLINIDLLGTLIIKHYLYSDLTNNYYEYNLASYYLTVVMKKIRKLKKSLSLAQVN